MSTSGISTTTSTASTAQDPAQSFTNATNNALGKDDFLKLLVTQLQYQDPMQPMNNTQFVAQLAQFSALEQMNNVATGVTNLQQSNQFGSGLQLLGTNVQVQTTDSTISGTVNAIKNDPTNGTIFVINNTDVPLSSIQSIEKG